MINKVILVCRIDDIDIREKSTVLYVTTWRNKDYVNHEIICFNKIKVGYVDKMGKNLIGEMVYIEGAIKNDGTIAANLLVKISENKQ